MMRNLSIIQISFFIICMKDDWKVRELDSSTKPSVSIKQINTLKYKYHIVLHKWFFLPNIYPVRQWVKY